MTRPTLQPLRAALRQTAEAAPPVAVPPGLFVRARRRHRRRQALALAATVAVVALLVFGVYPWLDRVPAQPAQSAAPGMPTRLVHAPALTAQLRRAPLDRAVAVFAGPDSQESEPFGDSFPLTVVGPADGYRVYQRPELAVESPTGPAFLLSPDGRHLLMPHTPPDGSSIPSTLVLDMRTGGTWELAGGAPLAWSPDGTRAILAAPATDPSDGMVFRVVEFATRHVDQSVTVSGGVNPRRISAALAPDGSRLAVQVGDFIQLYQGSTPLWRIEVTGSWLAGAAAFTPTGDVALFSVPDELRVLAAATGAPLTSRRYPSLPTMRADEPPTARLVAWRDGVPVVVTSNRGAWGDGVPLVVTGDRVVLLSEPVAVLLTAPDDIFELDIATDTLTRPAATPGRPHAGPFLVRFGALLIAGALTAPLVLLALIIVRRLYRQVRLAAQWQRELDSR